MQEISFEDKLSPKVCTVFSDLRRMDAEGVTLGKAIQSLLFAKRMGNCRPRYIDSLRAYLNQFAKGREHECLTGFDVLLIEQWFSGRSESHSTMASNVGRLSALFGFAERRGWIAKNPCKQLERIRVDRKPPKILTAQQTKSLMAYVVRNKPNETAFFTLSVFVGIRPEELERIGWDAVNLEAGIVTIDAAASKVRRRRIVELEPAAIRFLQFAKKVDARLPVKRMTRRRYLDHAEKVLGFDTWPQDCLRHTAASFLLALHKDPSKVAFRLGNSPGILMRHYSQLVSADDCTAFWSITP